MTERRIVKFCCGSLSIVERLSNELINVAPALTRQPVSQYTFGLADPWILYRIPWQWANSCWEISVVGHHRATNMAKMLPNSYISSFKPQKLYCCLILSVLKCCRVLTSYTFQPKDQMISIGTEQAELTSEVQLHCCPSLSSWWSRTCCWNWINTSQQAALQPKLFASVVEHSRSPGT